MRKDAVWSSEYGAFVAPAPEPQPQQNDIMPLCIMVITAQRYFDLYLNGKKIKRITYDDYLKNRLIVKGVFVECYTERGRELLRKEVS